MKKILFVFGTRPEAIKMAPICKKLNGESFDTRICITAQHREMLDQVLEFFEIKPDYDLDLMKPNQTLYSITADVITELRPVLEDFRPDFVFVHGDTTTSSAAALAAYYAGAQVCHIEAGLRTYDKWAPFPEEMNRMLTSKLTDIHFSPTYTSSNNLIREGIACEKIYTVGNSVIDALFWAKNKLETYTTDEIEKLKDIIDLKKKTILVTGHRRENFGEPFIRICKGLKVIAKRTDVQIIYPVHLNPNVQKPVKELLGDLDNVHLVDPLSYPSFVWMMKTADIILTDSGGVQEEAPSLGKPVLVMREVTERPEAVEAGTVILVGTSSEAIISNLENLLDDSVAYKSMSRQHNPYGDGTTSEQVYNIMKSYAKN